MTSYPATVLNEAHNLLDRIEDFFPNYTLRSRIYVLEYPKELDFRYMKCDEEWSEEVVDAAIEILEEAFDNLMKEPFFVFDEASEEIGEDAEGEPIYEFVFYIMTRGRLDDWWDLLEPEGNINKELPCDITVTSDPEEAKWLARRFFKKKVILPEDVTTSSTASKDLSQGGLIRRE